jgi:mutator protein MutT
MSEVNPGAGQALPQVERDLVRVLAAVVRRGDRYLVARRPAHKRHGGMWEFPGGKVEDGESTDQALQREVEEELGVQLQSMGRMLFSASDPDSVFQIEFIEVCIRGEPSCLEHESLVWASPVELRGMALAPSDRRFVEEHLR